MTLLDWLVAIGGAKHVFGRRSRSHQAEIAVQRQSTTPDEVRQVQFLASEKSTSGVLDGDQPASVGHTAAGKASTREVARIRLGV